jgi:hypothetical protein
MPDDIQSDSRPKPRDFEIFPGQCFYHVLIEFGTNCIRVTVCNPEFDRFPWFKYTDATAGRPHHAKEHTPRWGPWARYFFFRILGVLSSSSGRGQQGLPARLK